MNAIMPMHNEILMLKLNSTFEKYTEIDYFLNKLKTREDHWYVKHNCKIDFFVIQNFQNTIS